MGCGASSVAPVENDRPQDSKTDVVEVPNPKECASPTCTKDEGMKKDVSCRANSTKDDSSPVCSASGNDSKAASPLKKCEPSIPTDSSKSDVASESSPKLKDVQVESCSQSSPLATAPSQSSDTFRGMNSGAQETSSSQDQEQLVRVGSKHSEQ